MQTLSWSCYRYSILHQISDPKKSCDYRTPLNIESAFLSSSDSSEVSNINLSLSLDKRYWPNIVPTRRNKDISDQLAFLFNHSFSAGLFPSTLKTRKCNQYSGQSYNIQTTDFPLISNTDKILESLIYNSFLERKKYVIK